MNENIKRSIFIFVAASYFAQNAYAYIDPGTGSMIIQLLVAGVLSGLFTIKMWYASARNFIWKLRGMEVEETEADKSAGDVEDSKKEEG